MQLDGIFYSMLNIACREESVNAIRFVMPFGDTVSYF